MLRYGMMTFSSASNLSRCCCLANRALLHRLHKQEFAHSSRLFQTPLGSRRLFTSSATCLNEGKSDTQKTSEKRRKAPQNFNIEQIAASIATVNPRHLQLDVIDENVGDWVRYSPEFKEKLSYYMKLSKARLTGLVVLTAGAGYALAPGPFLPLTFTCMAVGTTLCSAAANSFNQFLEVPYDCQMSRTRDRVLVRGLLRPEDAVLFGLCSGIGGVGLLGLMVNPLTAVLGALNIILYAGVYTPSKRYSIANTWIGAVVGAIPPLMGWAACVGHLDMGALALGMILYAWQFPHFNALSWNYRPDYSRAGYKMMSVTDPALCRRVSLRYAAIQIPLAAAFPLLGATSWIFFLASLPINTYQAWLAYKFYRTSNAKSARTLFRFTLLHLPLLMVLLLICKYAKNFEGRMKASSEISPCSEITMTSDSEPIESVSVDSGEAHQILDNEIQEEEQ